MTKKNDLDNDRKEAETAFTESFNNWDSAHPASADIQIARYFFFEGVAHGVIAYRRVQQELSHDDVIGEPV